MSNNKFHKILSDTITLPLLPASQKITDTSYYAVLEKFEKIGGSKISGIIPITSDIDCIYKPNWITGYEFIKEGENENETKEELKYYNKLIITSTSDNITGKLRKDVMEFAVRNIDSILPINHIYAKVSQIPKENIEVHLEFSPIGEQGKNGLSADGGVISGDEQEIHIKYWAVLNGIKQSNVTLKLNNNLLDNNKIKSLKINSSDNTVELVYLIDENIDVEKELTFDAIFKTQYNKANKQKTITQKVNTYKITLEIDNPDHIVFNGDYRILTYKCTYTDGINNTPKDVKDYVQLEFSYIEDQNELKYSVIKTIYDTESNAFKTTIKVYENYTSEDRRLNVKAVYTGSKKIENDSITLIQDESNIKLQYYVEYLDRNTSENPTTNGTYNVSAFGETIRLHYYGIIKIDENSSVKITSITNTKNDISNTYTINALVNGKQDKNVILSTDSDEYILDINFDRYESTSIINDITKTIVFEMNNLSVSCTLTQSALLINLEVRFDKCTKIIGGIPEYNNIILTFRAYDNKKNITIEDINLYDITCDNNDVNLADIQYKIIKTDDNIKYIEASNIRCYYKKDYTNGIYDEKVDRTLTFTIKYNNITEEHYVQQYPVVYSCIINPSSNYVSALGEDNFEVTSVGIIKDRRSRDEEDKDIKQIESAVDVVKFTYTNNDNLPDYIRVIQGNRKLDNRSESIIKIEPCSNRGETTKKDIVFRIKVKYKDSDAYYDIKQLYLQIYIDLYKDSNYSTLIDYNSLRLNISPFINNILYYKCYVHEINETDHSHKNVDISKFQSKGFSITSDNWVDVQAYVDENPTYNEDDYTYRGKITIPRYICSKGVTYQFKYEQGYSENLQIYKKLNIYKPEIRTCTEDNLNPLPGTYIQYRSDKDSLYNDNKSILKIGNYDKRISSKDYQVTLYYRTVFTIILGNTDNYIYGNDYKTYIDLDKTHFVSFIDQENITIDNNAFENAGEETFNNSSYLKITFKVNKNDDLLKREITKSIKYQFIDDNINGIDYHYKQHTFTNYYDNINNRIEIYQNGASLDLDAFFDSSNSGTITDNGRIITYNAKPHSSQNLHVKVLLNDELQPTQSDYFKFNDDNKFSINDGILDLNTYKSEYNLQLYIGLENETYTFHYCYNGNDENKTEDLTVIRTSFGRDKNCELNATISKTEISNNDETVTIIFWLEYTNDKDNKEIIDLGEDAITKFNYDLSTNISTQLIPGKTINVIYDSESKKYSFDYKIDANPTTKEKEYTFSIRFGDEDSIHKKELKCTQSGSSYELKATISPSTLSPLSISNIIIKCHIEKDNNGQIYQDVNPDIFSIIQTNENEAVPILNALETKPSGLLQGEYGKEYPVPDNKTADHIIYKFKCSYTLNGNEYSKDLSITQNSATFDVSIYDGETDQSKQNIVNPVGETKTINYFGILNGEHVIDLDKITFLYDNKNYITDVGGPVKNDGFISRNVTFGLNNSSTQIPYTFTAKYEGKEQSITLTQKAVLFELHASACYMRGSTKIEDDVELDLNHDDSGYFYIQYYAQVKGDTTIDLNTSHYIVEYSVYDDGDMTYELPINFAFVDTTVDNVNNTIVNKYSFSKNNNDSYDYERYVNFKITFNYIPSVEAAEVLVMQNSSYTIEMAPFDFLIFNYIFLDGNFVTVTKDTVNTSSGYDLDTITHITTKTDTLIPYEITDTDKKSKVFINNLTAGFKKTVDSSNTKYNDIIRFGNDNIIGGYESVYINLKNIVDTIKNNPDTKFQKKCRYIYIDLYGHWYNKMGTGRVKITYNTYNMKGNNPNLTLDDHIFYTTDTHVTSQVINTIVLDKQNSPLQHYTLLGRLTYDMAHSKGNLNAKTLYGYNFKQLDASIDTSTRAQYYKFDRIYKDYNVTVIYIGEKYFQYNASCKIADIKITKNNVLNIADREIILKPFLYSYTYGLQKGIQYNEITSISINTSTTDHLICELVNGVFKLKIKETYVNHTYNWPTDKDKQIDIGINYSPTLKINGTETIKLFIRVIEKKYTQTT